MHPKRYFITGTDTDVGKTVVTSALLKGLAMKGRTTVGLKPLASGAKHTPTGYQNEDALMLIQNSTMQLPYHHVNPLVFEKPVAPHFLSEDLSVEQLYSVLDPALKARVDYMLIEGVGGWHVPLNKTEYMSDFAKRLAVPVILVVGLRLGCLNHALLTVNAIANAGLPLAGWVANTVDNEMLNRDENIVTLKQRINAPLLGVIPYQTPLDIDALAMNLNVDSL